MLGQLSIILSVIHFLRCMCDFFFFAIGSLHVQAVGRQTSVVSDNSSSVSRGAKCWMSSDRH